MLATTYTLTYNAESLVLNKINQDSNGSVFYGKLGTDRDVTLTVKHTFPKSRVNPGTESHLVRFDIAYYNAVDGKLLRSDSAWTVLQTKDGVQVNASLKSTYELITEFLTSMNQDAILDRRS